MTDLWKKHFGSKPDSVSGIKGTVTTKGRYYHSFSQNERGRRFQFDFPFLDMKAFRYVFQQFVLPDTVI